jgi:hypothetical protein
MGSVPSFYGDPDLHEEHAGGGHHRGDKLEPKFGIKMIGLVGALLMISYLLVTSARRSDFKKSTRSASVDQPWNEFSTEGLSPYMPNHSMT